MFELPSVAQEIWKSKSFLNQLTVSPSSRRDHKHHQIFAFGSLTQCLFSQNKYQCFQMKQQAMLFWARYCINLEPEREDFISEVQQASAILSSAGSISSNSTISCSAPFHFNVKGGAALAINRWRQAKTSCVQYLRGLMQGEVPLGPGRGKPTSCIRHIQVRQIERKSREVYVSTGCVNYSICFNLF